MNELEKKNPFEYQRIGTMYDTFQKMSKEEYIEFKHKEIDRRKRNNLLVGLILFILIYGLLFAGLLTIRYNFVSNYKYDYLQLSYNARQNSIYLLSNELCKSKNQTYIKTEVEFDKSTLYCNKETYILKQ